MERFMVIGLLGGMGTYATINIFRQYAEIFQAEKEWDRPRIIIDNRCTMPSRVRAYIYDEKKEILIHEMSDSLVHLSEMGCDKIILGCNTAHLFLPYIIENNRDLENKIINIIEVCCKKVVEDNVKQVFLIASEGTIDSGIYQKAFEPYGINCTAPSQNEYSKLRYCIEAVKQNKYSDKVKEIFIKLLSGHENCILGCTELPVLYQKYNTSINSKRIYDPIYLALKSIQEQE